MIDQIFAELKKENDEHERQLRELSIKCGVAEPVCFFDLGFLPPDYIDARGVLRDIYAGKVCAYSQAIQQISAQEKRQIGKSLSFAIPGLKTYAEISVFFDLLSIFTPKFFKELIDNFKNDRIRQLWQCTQGLDTKEKTEEINISSCNREVLSFLRMYLMRRLDKWDACRLPKTENVKLMIAKRLADFSPWVQSSFGWQYVLLKRLAKIRRHHKDLEYAQGLSNVAEIARNLIGFKFKVEQSAMVNLYNYHVFSQSDFQVYIDLLMVMPVPMQNMVVESLNSEAAVRFKTQCSITAIDQTDWEPVDSVRMKHYLTLARFELDALHEQTPSVVH